MLAGPKDRWTAPGASRTAAMCQLLVLLLIVPLAELFLLIRVGEAIGLAWTLALVLVTGLLGATLARHQGLSALRRIQEETAAGRVPGDALLDGALILVAGIVLVTPGILTDVLGFLCLVPALRRRLRSWLAERYRRAVSEGRVQVSWGDLRSRPPLGAEPRGGVRDVEHEDVDRRPME
jgi:UPF0716 protein FxsA